MSKPIFEDTDQRNISRINFGERQDERRPSVSAGDSDALIASWIRVRRDLDVTLPDATFTRPFLGDTNTTWQESDNLDGSMFPDLQDFGGTDYYVIRILLPGVYTCRATFAVTGLAANSTCRTDIDAAVIQDTVVDGDHHYEYSELSATFTSISAVSSIVVTQEDIDETEPDGTNYIHPLVRQEGGSPEVIADAQFIIWRLPIEGMSS